MMMVFVLLTFGGWNEAVYLSAELRDGRRRMGHAMILGLIVVAVLYLLVNLAYLRALSLGGMAASDAVAADVMDRAFGAGGAALMSRSEEHTSELQSLMRISYAVFCLKKKQ